MNETDLWDPFKRLRKAEEKMRRMLDIDSFEPGFREPLVDVADMGKQIRVVAELPGVEKKDIELSVDSIGLRISAKSGFEKKEEKKEQGYFYHERRMQGFFRTIPLPVEVLPEKAIAEFKNGILSVTIPKKRPGEKQKGHMVSIK